MSWEMLVAAAPAGVFTSLTSSRACSSVADMKKMSRSDDCRSEASVSACSVPGSAVAMAGEVAVPPSCS